MGKPADEIWGEEPEKETPCQPTETKTVQPDTTQNSGEKTEKKK